MTQYFIAWVIADFSLFERRANKMWARIFAFSDDWRSDNRRSTVITYDLLLHVSTLIRHLQAAVHVDLEKMWLLKYKIWSTKYQMITFCKVLVVYHAIRVSLVRFFRSQLWPSFQVQAPKMNRCVMFQPRTAIFEVISFGCTWPNWGKQQECLRAINL